MKINSINRYSLIMGSIDTQVRDLEINNFHDMSATSNLI